MRDWEPWVAARLREHGAAGWDEATLRRVTGDVAEMLADGERDALEQGASAAHAIERAQALVPDWEALARGIEAADTVPEDTLRGQTELVNDPRPVRRPPARGRTRSGLLAGLGRDLRSALRSAARAPGLSAVVVITLALGIGANAATFSLVDAVLLAPLPYPQPDQLMRVFSDHAGEGIERAGVSTGDVVEWRLRSSAPDSTLRGIGAWYTSGRTLSSIGAASGAPASAQPAEIVDVAQVSEDFFAVLGVTPTLGRTFTREETAAATFNSAAAHTGADPVAVLSHRAWVERFGGDPAVLERTLVLDRQTWRIAGVMPAGFDFPDPGVDLWIPWSFEGERPHDQRYVSAIARLAPGISLEQAESQLDAIAAVLGDELPDSNAGWGVTLAPLREEIVGGSRLTLLVLLGAVALVLLVACSNIACLQLSRIGERHRELSVRLALGASRLRIARQLLVESLVLALAGGVAALLVADGAIRIARALGSAAVPRLDGVNVDLRVLGVAAAASLLAGSIFGLLPLGASPRGGLAEAMGAARGRTAGGSPRWERLRRALVVGELAMAVVLLAAAGLLVRSFVQLQHVDAGFRPERVAVLPIALDNHEYTSGAASRAYYRELLERLAAVPGVVSAGAATALPMSPIGPDFDRPIWAQGEQPPPGGAQRAAVRMATPGYFRTLGIPVRRGRAFDQRDTPESTPVVMVNERLAREIWPGENPLGRQLVVDYSTSGTYPYEVVGVVGDVRFAGLRAEPRPEIYFPHAQRSYLVMNVAVRTERDPDSIIPELQRVVLEVDPLQPAYRVAPLAELVASSIARDRFAATLIGGFGVVALALALVGILGVLSYHVARRVPEVGVRAALGATRRELVVLMLRSGLRLTVAGLGLGVVAAIATTRVLSGLLFEVSPIDPLTFAGVLLATGAAAVVACWVPARRAASVDPIVALRHE